jgi:glycine/D-amino acid oxidase-like deaminating enzyme
MEQVTSIKGAKAAGNVPACSFWPYKFVSQLAARLVERKAINLQTNTPVLKVLRSADGVTHLLTARGAVQAKKVVFASNAWTSGICPQLTNKIVPYRGTACHIRPLKPVSPHLSTTYNIRYVEGGRVDYLNPRPDGGIVVGGGKWTFEHDRSLWYNNWDDSKLIPAVRPHFDDYMQRYFKGWEDSGAEVDHVWTGIMAYTADELPLIGPMPGSPDHFVIAGFNGGGMDKIFLSARGIAEMVLNGTPFQETELPRRYEVTTERLAVDDDH